MQVSEVLIKCSVLQLFISMQMFPHLVLHIFCDLSRVIIELSRENERR